MAHQNNLTDTFFWTWIKDIAKTISDPWVLIGDFNQIISEEDKLSKNGSSSGINLFKSSMEEAGLDLISYQGPNFTWTNKRKGDNECLEWIDLAFCNPQWTLLFPCSYVQHMGIAASDHSPIILHTKPHFKKSKGRKFEKLWYLFLECTKIIKDS